MYINNVPIYDKLLFTYDKKLKLKHYFHEKYSPKYN